MIKSQPMRDIIGVIDSIIPLIPDSWGMKSNIVSRLHKIKIVSTNTPHENMGMVWRDFFSAIGPIIQIPGVSWTIKISEVLAGESNGGQVIDFTKVKEHDDLIKFLKKCSTCGTKSQMVGSSLFAGRKNYYVLCLTCRERTAEFDTPADLIKFWNFDQKFEKIYAHLR